MDSTREQAKDAINSGSAPGISPRLNQYRLHTPGHGRRALLRWISNGLMETYPGFLLRSQIVRYPALQEYYSKQLAILEARRAYESVPAYREFIDQQCGSINNIEYFSDLPEMHKANYIKPYGSQDKNSLYVKLIRW